MECLFESFKVEWSIGCQWESCFASLWIGAVNLQITWRHICTFARLHNMQKFQPRTCYNVALLYICSCDVVQMKWRLELSNCGRLEVWKYLNLTPETQFEAKLSLLCQFRNNFSASRSNKVYSVSGLWKAAGGAKLTVGWQ